MQAVTTEKIREKTTTGYDFTIPKRPLTLPTKRTTTSAGTTVTEATTTQHKILVPEGGSTLPRRTSTAATTITTPTDTKPGTIVI